MIDVYTEMIYQYISVSDRICMQAPLAEHINNVGKQSCLTEEPICTTFTDH
jgi:hypothetical protein